MRRVADSSPSIASRRRSHQSNNKHSKIASFGRASRSGLVALHSVPPPQSRIHPLTRTREKQQPHLTTRSATGAVLTDRSPQPNKKPSTIASFGRASRSGLVAVDSAPPPQSTLHQQTLNPLQTSLPPPKKKIHTQPTPKKKKQSQSGRALSGGFVAVDSVPPPQPTIHQHIRTLGRDVVHSYSTRRHATGNSTPTTA